MASSLLPLIPDAFLCSAYGLEHDPGGAGAVYYLNKHADVFDRCVVLGMYPDLIRRIQDETPVAVIPHLHLEDDPYSMAALPFGLDNGRREYADWLESRAETFPRVLLANQVYETQAHSRESQEWLAVYRALRDLLPWARDKIALSPLAANVTRSLKLPESRQPMLDFLAEAKPLILFFDAKWVAKLVHGRGEYLRDYLRGLRETEVYSGIDLAEGARNHNLARMRDFGYDGCLFYLPSIVSEISDRMMEDYLTDIENGK